MDDMSSINGAYQRYSPYRSQQWRWDRVLQVTHGADRSQGCTKYDDKWVSLARSFYKSYMEAPDKRHDLFLQDPGLYYAHEIYKAGQDDPAKSLIIEARIMSREPLHDIARRSKTLPDAILWYARLFFDVLNNLDDDDWVNLNIIQPAMVRNMGGLTESYKKTAGRFPFIDQVIAKPFMDASLKYFAYHGGPVVLDYLLYGAKRGKQIGNQDDLDKYFDSHWATACRSRSAQAMRTFEINKYNVMELFQVHTQIIALEKGEDGKSAQQTTIERHVSGMLDELPWTVGRKERTDKFAGSEVARQEAGSAAELRDDEIMFASARTPLPQGLADAMQIKIPPPRKKDPAQEPVPTSKKSKAHKE